MASRQQVLYLWLAEGALDTETVAWAFHDGSDGQGPQLPDAEPPYQTGLDALREGWFLVQSPAPYALRSGTEHDVGYLANEFVFERKVVTGSES